MAIADGAERAAALAEACRAARGRLGEAAAVTIWTHEAAGLRLRGHAGCAATFHVARPNIGLAGRAFASGAREGVLAGTAGDPALYAAGAGVVAALAVPFGSPPAGVVLAESLAPLDASAWDVLDDVAAVAAHAVDDGLAPKRSNVVAHLLEALPAIADPRTLALRTAEAAAELGGFDAVMLLLLGEGDVTSAAWARPGCEHLVLGTADLRAVAERLHYQVAASTGEADGVRPPDLDLLLADGRGFVGAPMRAFDGIRGYLLGRVEHGGVDLGPAVDDAIGVGSLAAGALDRAEHALREAEVDRAHAAAGVQIVRGVVDEVGRRLEPGTRVERLIGHTDPDGAHDPLLARVHRDDADRAARATARLREHGEATFEYRVVRGDGRVAYLRERAWLEPGRGPGAFTSMVVETSRERQAEERLREADELHRAVVEAMTEGVVVQDATGRIVSWNASAERILGLTADELAGRTSIDPRWRSVHGDGSTFPGEDHPAMVTLRTGLPQRDVPMGIWTVDEGLRWISISTEPCWRIGEQQPRAVVSTFADVTDRTEAMERLRARIATLEAVATRDELTGLAGASSLRAAIADAIARAATQGRHAGLILVDLDAFSDLNDAAGWDAGDEALRQVAAAIGATSPDAVCVARTGGDGFAVLIGDATALEARAEAVRAAVAALGVRAGQRSLTACVGAAAAGRGRDASALIGGADRALRQAKRAGLDRAHVESADASTASVRLG